MISGDDVVQHCNFTRGPKGGKKTETSYLEVPATLKPSPLADPIPELMEHNEQVHHEHDQEPTHTESTSDVLREAMRLQAEHAQANAAQVSTGRRQRARKMNHSVMVCIFSEISVLHSLLIEPVVHLA
jgi:hypothetical protein